MIMSGGLLKSNFVICAFHIGNHYEVCARKLKEDCEKFGHEYDISSPRSLHRFIKKKPTGVDYRNWVCRYKPQFIRDMLIKHNKVIIYLDVDGRVAKEISIKKFKPYKLGLCQERGERMELFNSLVSCILFKPDKIIFDFLWLWEYKCLNIPINVADHWFFKTTLLDFGKYSKLRMGYVDKGGVFAANKPKYDPKILIDARKYRRK